MLDTLVQSGAHLRTLVDDILDLAKMDSGQERLRRTVVDLKPLCEGVLQMVVPSVDTSRVGLRLEYRSAREQLMVDPHRVRQLLLNLLGNAAKFTDAGTITLIAEDLDSVAGLPQICLRVRDSGIGIAPEDQARLFDSFYQVDHGGKRPRQGTGLGLAISQRVAQLHGGSLVVYSAEGKGSTFSAFFPVATSMVKYT